MQVEERINYQQLSGKIGNDNEIQSALKEGYEILLKAKQSPELYNKFQKEYEELYRSIKEAFENDKRFSKEERAKIMFELSDIIQIAQSHGIVEKKGAMSKLGDWWKGTNTNEVKAKAQTLREKNIKEYSTDEAISAMNYLNHNYTKYPSLSGDDTISKAQRGVSQLLGSYSNIQELDNQHEVRLFQDELSKKIFGEGKGFNDTHVLGFNNKKGNFLIKIQDFENELKTSNINDINSKALSNYFLHLESKGQLNSKKLVEVFGEGNLLELKKLWLDKKDIFDDKKDIAKKTLEEKGILKTILGLIEVFSSSDKLIQMLVSNMKNPSEQANEQEEIALLFIKKNIKQIQEKIKTDIKNQYLKTHPGEEKKAQEIAQKMVQELSTCKTKNDIQKALKIFYTYSQEHKIEFDSKSLLQDIFASRKAETQLGLMETGLELRKKQVQLQQAKESKDVKKQKEIEEEIRESQKQIDALNAQMTDNQIGQKLLKKASKTDLEKLATGGEEAFKKFEQEARKKDKTLDALYTKYETEIKQYYTSYPEEKDKQTKKQSKDNEASSLTLERNLMYSEHTLTYENGTTLSYTTSAGGYSIDTGENKLYISPDEFKTISSSQEALKNMIHFKETLDELNLSKLWDYRESIFTGIKNNHLFQIDTNGDYINTDELKVFLRSILIALGIPCDVPNTLEDIKGEIFLINKGGILNGQEDVNIYGESSIENKFIQKFTDDRKNSPEMVTQLFSEGLAKNS